MVIRWFTLCATLLEVIVPTAAHSFCLQNRKKIGYVSSGVQRIYAEMPDDARSHIHTMCHEIFSSTISNFSSSLVDNLLAIVLIPLDCPPKAVFEAVDAIQPNRSAAREVSSRRRGCPSGLSVSQTTSSSNVQDNAVTAMLTRASPVSNLQDGAI